MLALVIVGQMRTYDNVEIINSYKKYLYKNEKIDLYVFTWKKIGYSYRHGITNSHERMNDSINESDILEHYTKYDFVNVKYIFIEDFDIFIKGLNDDILKIYNTPFRNHGATSTCIPIQYKYQQAIRYLSNLNDVEKYSNVIIARPDIRFVEEFPVLDTKLDNIYWNCVCIRCMDHCWYGKPKTIIKQLYNAFDDILKNYNEITSDNQNNRDNNELLHHQCSKNNIVLNVSNKHVVEMLYF